MILNTRKLILGFAALIMLLPMMALASTEYKGTETVNINKANAATLAAYLKGVGANKAEAIVKYRKSNGNFKSLADLKEVPGIGEETYKGVKSKISTSSGKTSAPTGYKLSETSGKTTTSKKKSTTAKSTAKAKSTATSSKSKTASKKSSTSDNSAKSKSSKATKTADKKKSTSESKSSKTKSTAKKSKAKAKTKKKKEEKKKS